MREVVPGCRRGIGADPVAPRSRVGSDNRAVSWDAPGPRPRAERWDQAESGGLGLSSVATQRRTFPICLGLPRGSRYTTSVYRLRPLPFLHQRWPVSSPIIAARSFWQATRAPYLNASERPTSFHTYCPRVGSSELGLRFPKHNPAVFCK